MKLRPYQARALRELRERLLRKRYVVLVSPSGAGKAKPR